MATVERNHPYPDTDRFWNLVQETLEHVFQERTSLADTLKKEISTRSAEEQLLFYHAEPLEVAADLAGKRPSANDIRAYLQLASRVGWTSP